MTAPLHQLLDSLEYPLHVNLSLVRQPGGLCNRLYRLTQNSEVLALRVNNPDAEGLGVDRAAERALLEQVKDQSWCPVIIEAKQTYLLSRWQEGQIPACGAETDLNWLAQALMAVHSTAVKTSPLNMAQRLEDLLALGPNWPSTSLAAVRELIRGYEFPADVCLCHHDWHPGNLIHHDQGWTLLDWEYAANGDPALDTASACLGFNLNTTQQARLAKHLSLDEKRLLQARCLMEALALAWYRANPGITLKTTDTPDAWLARWGHAV